MRTRLRHPTQQLGSGCSANARGQVLAKPAHNSITKAKLQNPQAAAARTLQFPWGCIRIPSSGAEPVMGMSKGMHQQTTRQFR